MRSASRAVSAKHTSQLMEREFDENEEQQHRERRPCATRARDRTNRDHATADIELGDSRLNRTLLDTKLDRDAVLDLECDISIPAARPDVLTVENVTRLGARLVAQGANIPVTLVAETALHEPGVLSIPDFIANAGGFICAAVEYHGGNDAQAFASIEEKIRDNVGLVLHRARSRRAASHRGARARRGAGPPSDAARSLARPLRSLTALDITFMTDVTPARTLANPGRVA